MSLGSVRMMLRRYATVSSRLSAPPSLRSRLIRSFLGNTSISAPIARTTMPSNARHDRMRARPASLGATEYDGVFANDAAFYFKHITPACAALAGGGLQFAARGMKPRVKRQVPFKLHLLQIAHGAP